MRIDKIALAAALEKMAKGLDFAQTGPCASQAEAEMAMGVGRLAKMAQEYLHLVPEDTEDPPEAPAPGIPWGDVKWLDVPDVMSWKRVSPLKATLSGEFIKFSFSAPQWPDKDCYGVQVYSQPMGGGSYR